MVLTQKNALFMIPRPLQKLGGDSTFPLHPHVCVCGMFIRRLFDRIRMWNKMSVGQPTGQVWSGA